MRPFLLTSAARDDMMNIGRFTGERWGKQQRNTYLKQLDGAFKLLAQQPEIGKAWIQKICSKQPYYFLPHRY